MAEKSLQSELQELIAQKDWEKLQKTIRDWPPAEIADILLTLDKSERVLLFRALPRPLSSEVFSYLDRKDQDALLKELTDEETRQLLANLAPDDRTFLLAELPGKVTQRLLNLLSPEDLEESRKLLGYPEESVGRLMTPIMWRYARTGRSSRHWPISAR